MNFSSSIFRLVGLALLGMGLPGCGRGPGKTAAQTPSEVAASQAATPSPQALDALEESEGFASDRLPGATPLELDGKRAMEYLERICALGPRISGTFPMHQQQELLRQHFEKLGGRVQLQEFTVQQVSRREPVLMINLLVSWFPERPRRVLFCTHYDTRPLADREPDPQRWRQPFLGANDGGSGVAFLMELAHHLPALKTPVGIDFAFFDGEEYIFDPRKDIYFFGSEQFAQRWQRQRPRPNYQAAILLDMIAGKNPHFPVEGHSAQLAGPLARQLWRTAQQLRCTAFQWRLGEFVRDDHLALLRVGIPTVDIIDFNYPHWHLLSDVPANCSPEGFLQVGRVLTAWLQQLPAGP
jgi:glutaminyl-peptide cyclotransferase